MKVKSFALLLLLLLVPSTTIGYLLYALPPKTQSSDFTDMPNVVSGTGVITYLGFEGGFFGIVSDDGEHYDPVNLPPEFGISGLKVSFKVQIMEDWMSYHMWGKIVKILLIERI
jgi:hypothetical protein